MFKTTRYAWLLWSATALAIGISTSSWAGATTDRVSLGPGGVQGNADSNHPVVSADGRFVAFASRASNLVVGDTNGRSDVFVRDRQAGTTERASLGTGGAQGNTGSFSPAISADGRFVAFESRASNLVPGDTNSKFDVFVRDRQAGTIERVSLGPGGIQGNGKSKDPAISTDGRFVAFISWARNLVLGDSNGEIDVFVRDRQTSTTERISLGSDGAQGNGSSFEPSISADARFVAFTSDASNLVSGDTNRVWDVFAYDRQTGTTRRVSVGPSGVQGEGGYSNEPAISADGSFVAFSSFADNLVRGDTSIQLDVFARDLKARTTERVSLGSGGVEGNAHSFSPSPSADGRVVAFSSYADNLVLSDTNAHTDVFVRTVAP